jgi:hypothetical protein
MRPRGIRDFCGAKGLPEDTLNSVIRLAAAFRKQSGLQYQESASRMPLWRRAMRSNVCAEQSGLLQRGDHSRHFDEIPGIRSTAIIAGAAS